MNPKKPRDKRELCYPFIFETQFQCDYEIATDELGPRYYRYTGRCKQIIVRGGVKISPEELDEIEYHGEMFDLGEAVAQSLALAIDPYAEGPNADAARKAAGIVLEGEQDGPLAAFLAGLKKN